MGYRRSSRPDHMDVTTGSLDNPEVYPPTVEIWLDHKIEWEQLNPDVPNRQQSSLNAPDGE